MAVGGISTIEHDQQVAWKQGTAAFRFTDSRGTVGREGVSYTAWQLPNNYQGPHDKLPKGKLKRINRELADLFMKGMTGNGKGLFQEDNAYPTKHVHLFYNSPLRASN